MTPPTHITEEAIAILSERHGKIDDMGHSEYDAAWIARVPIPNTRTPAFPSILTTLRQNQRTDGSWGASAPYTSARLLCTLASVLALVEFEPQPGDTQRVTRALEYVRQAWSRLAEDPELTAGFELLSASLISEICNKGMPLHDLLPHSDRLRREKLSRIPEEALYSPHLSIGNSLEFLGRDLNVDKARQLQKKNGSINASVATTAYFARLTGDQAALDYLRECLSTYGEHRIPYGAPAYLWAVIWILYNLKIGGILDAVTTYADPHIEAIHRNVSDWGLSWSTHVDYGDADDTAIGLSLLAHTGHTVDWSLLSRYKKGNHFVTYTSETHPSISVNAHALTAAQEFCYPLSERATNDVVQFLVSRQNGAGYWTDKWHASPFYPTSRVIRAIRKLNLSASMAAVRWILQTQRKDGSWGFYEQGTAEETAHCVQALAAWNEFHGNIDRDVFIRARRLLEMEASRQGHNFAPRLWISKTLYHPSQINHSSVLAALNLCTIEENKI